MGKLKEYLKLIPDGIKNIDKVVEGMANEVRMEFGIIKPEHEEVIITRRLICSTCPYQSENAVKAGWYGTARNDKHCTMCGCPLGPRTASLSSNCGIEVYNQNPTTQIPLELKWTKIEDDEY